MDESKNKVFCSAEYCQKLKAMLRAAMSDLENAEDCDSCIYNGESCPGVSGDCEYKWKHHDEAMKLLKDGESNG